MIRVAHIVVIVLLALSTEASTPWQAEYARQVDQTRTGMTVGEVKRVVTQRPFGSRIYRNGDVDVFEWTFPTGEQRWSTLVFEGGVLKARQDRTAPTYPRQRAVSSEEDTSKRQKLRLVQVGQPISVLDATKVVPSSTMTSANIREMLASPDLAKFAGGIDAVGAAFGSPSTFSGVLSQLDPATFDEIRSFELSGDTVAIFVKDARVTELQVTANPDEQWVLNKLASALAAKKPVTADFERLKPGMTVMEVVMTVGIPTSEDKKTTADGTETTMRYRLSRKQQFEILIRNDVVVSITTHASY
jgi:hypothetical protein